MLDPDVIGELQQTVRRLLANVSDASRIRAQLGDQSDLAAELWRHAQDLGLYGIASWTPAHVEGLYVAVAVAMEIGYSLAPMPFVAQCVLAPLLLSEFEMDADSSELVTGLRHGTVCSTLALASVGEARGASTTTDIAGRVGVHGAEIAGNLALVPDFSICDYLLVPLRIDGHETRLAALDLSDTAVHSHRLPTIDGTRDFGTITFEAELPLALLSTHPLSSQTQRRVRDMGALLYAADAVGAARRALDISVQYARDRHQFGHPIGSFQAVKHRLADMKLLVEASAALVLDAALAAETGRDDATRQLLSAVAYARDAATRTIRGAVQVHGGIGFTWEHDCHLLFKRAEVDANLCGSSAEIHRRAIAELSGGASKDIEALRSSLVAGV